MKYILTTLTPIHIGTGSQINNWSYSINGNKISIYDFDKVVRKLKNNPQRLLNLSAEIERNPLNKTLGDVLENFKLNVDPLYTIQLKGEIKNEKNNQYKQIWEFIKENRKVYIPGTEIKGAIRTALFYKILKDKFKENESLKKKFLNEYKNCLNVKEFKNEKDKKKKIQNKFKKLTSRWENYIFRGSFDNSDAKKDILRILLVSDTNKLDPKSTLSVKDIIGVNIRSRKVKDLHEVVEKNTNFELDITVSGFIKKALIECGISENQASLPKLFIAACKEFSKNLIIEEYMYFKNNSFDESIDKNKIMSFLNKIFLINKEKGKIVLRLGKHQGFLSTTINLLVKEIAPDLYSEAYKYLVHKGYPNFPNKSRKITIDNELLGWCVLIPE